MIPGSAAPAPDDYGDGVFETLHLRPDGPWLLDAHLDRIARSAALLDLIPPSRDVLAAQVHRAAEEWTGGEAALRLVCRRGPVSYATVAAVPDRVLDQRRHGIRVITAEPGVSIHRPPWSLSSAKTLSYAPNLAARRWAAARGVDDMIWFAIEGYALEAPTASLVWLSGDRLCTVPAGGTGILPGTTAECLLDRAAGLGLRAGTELVTRADLAAADAIWLASSLRGLAEVIELDGRPRPRSAWTPRLLDLLGFATG